MSDDKTKSSNGKVDAEFLDFSSLTVDETRKLAHGTEEDRAKVIISASKVTKDQILSKQKMSFIEEMACILLLAFGVPNGIFTLPPVIYLIGTYVVGNLQLTIAIVAAVMLPLAILPQAYTPSTLQSWMAVQVIKYFSFRFIFEARPPKKDDPNYHPQILVAPPHGVFPYGNLLAMLAWPTLCGQTFRGLAASAALRVPIFKQILRSIGIIDASRHVARKTLENGDSLGISTGGVAEVFETNSDDECIVLKQRIGLIKLAIRTGSDLVPCYLFGNTDLLGCWAGEGVPQGRSVLEWISRKVGFALIIIYGRFGLPIPRRIPILGVMGKPIPTHHIKCEDPTKEQIETIQTLLLDGMQEIFEKYKGLYGWEKKHLIIK
jgi:1-acyl-sn-glycerol-3-phosphate acyltransferase